MTRIDRYVLTIFLRTVLIGFLSISGVFIVFHAFTSMDKIAKLAVDGESMGWVMICFYGPYLLLMFDWTAAIIALMAALFSVGVLRRSGELTSTLAAGVSHGRLFQPIIWASIAIVAVQAINRECLLPRYRHVLKMKSRDIGSDGWQDVTARYDQVRRILIDGSQIEIDKGVINAPTLKIDGNYRGFGDLVVAKAATWRDDKATGLRGYLLSGVARPDALETLPSATWKQQPILMTPRDYDWLGGDELFVQTSVSPELLVTNITATRRASLAELARTIGNPAVHSPLGLKVLFHERVLRPLLDAILVLLGLPLMVNRRGRNVFVMMAFAMGTVLAFFIIKTLAGAMGSSGYGVSPAIAAWLPILLMGPIAYVRFREVQLV